MNTFWVCWLMFMVFPFTETSAEPDVTDGPVGRPPAMSVGPTIMSCAMKIDTTLSQKLFRKLSIPRFFISPPLSPVVTESHEVSRPPRRFILLELRLHRHMDTTGISPRPGFVLDVFHCIAIVAAQLHVFPNAHAHAQPHAQEIDAIKLSWNRVAPFHVSVVAEGHELHCFQRRSLF